jgi:hypothetical protein
VRVAYVFRLCGLHHSTATTHGKSFSKICGGIGGNWFIGGVFGYSFGILTPCFCSLLSFIPLHLSFFVLLDVEGGGEYLVLGELNIFPPVLSLYVPLSSSILWSPFVSSHLSAVMDEWMDGIYVIGGQPI